MRSGYVMIATIFLFFVLIGFAMLLYSGGTVVEPAAVRFQFWGNFLSDLGRTETFVHVSNLVPRLFFIVALATMGAAQGYFYRDMLGFLSLKSRTRSYQIFVWACWITGLTRIGVAVTPWDKVGLLHLAMVQLAFFSGLILSFLFLREARKPDSWLAPFLRQIQVWFGCQTIYLSLLMFGPFLHIQSSDGLLVAAGSQRIVMAVELWVVLRLAWALERRIRPGVVTGA